jgi:hypothetical protein
MATLLKVLNNLADIKSAGGVALRVRTQGGRDEVDRHVAVPGKSGPISPGNPKGRCHAERKRLSDHPAEKAARLALRYPAKPRRADAVTALRRQPDRRVHRSARGLLPAEGDGGGIGRVQGASVKAD